MRYRAVAQRLFCWQIGKKALPDETHGHLASARFKKGAISNLYFYRNEDGLYKLHPEGATWA